MRPAASWRIATISPTLVRFTEIAGLISQRRNFSVFSKSPEYSEAPLMDLVTFESSCNDTLESLTDYFEELVETDPNLQNADIGYSVSSF